MHVIAPWSPRRQQPDDAARLELLLDHLDLEELPAPVCWCWPDREPVPVANADPSWEHHQELVFVGVQPLQQAIKRDEACTPLKDAMKRARNSLRRRRVGASR